ncbi:hypothetical protein XELAEV_18028721mg [Xenopus laevis]|uniref:Uncharacterized protein n=1 Tax=Xenopus laevis TaxID=8355 RepID=A0A974HH40_XENLA|nr:hypothetical protein XELAEV_18028721mg [Xenopus laevis]
MNPPCSRPVFIYRTAPGRFAVKIAAPRGPSVKHVPPHSQGCFPRSTSQEHVRLQQKQNLWPLFIKSGGKAFWPDAILKKRLSVFAYEWRMRILHELLGSL